MRARLSGNESPVGDVGPWGKEKGLGGVTMFGILVLSFVFFSFVILFFFLNKVKFLA